jgi:hypothetical protein
MRTRFILLLAIVLLSGGLVSASVKETPKGSNQLGRMLERGFSNYVASNTENYEGNVTFALRATEDNSVEYQILASDSDALSNFVKNRIEKMSPRLAKHLNENEEQIFKLKFKTRH